MKPSKTKNKRAQSARGSYGTVEQEVEELIKETLKKNRKELEMSLIKPLTPSYPFSTNGVYYLIGKMGSGKSFWIWKHIMITERLFKNPYYSKIIFCTSSGKMDRTSEAFSEKVKTPVDFIKEDELISFLQRHLRRKNKYYAIVKHVMSKMKKTNEEMQRLIEKHSLEDIEDRIIYIANKIMKYGTTDYPYNTLLILDDAADSDLLKKNSPLIKIMTKTRHYNLTVIAAIQTLRFIHLNAKRLATDVICYAGYSKEDFESLLTQTPNDLDKKSVTKKYLELKDPHSKFVMNITAGKYSFE